MNKAVYVLWEFDGAAVSPTGEYVQTKEKAIEWVMKSHDTDVSNRFPYRTFTKLKLRE